MVAVPVCLLEVPAMANVVWPRSHPQDEQSQRGDCWSTDDLVLDEFHKLDYSLNYKKYGENYTLDRPYVVENSFSEE